MKILRPDHHTPDDLHEARDRGMSTTYQSTRDDLTQIALQYMGPPAHIVWDYIDGIPTGYAVPYDLIELRRDNFLAMVGPVQGDVSFCTWQDPYSRIGISLKYGGCRHIQKKTADPRETVDVLRDNPVSLIFSDPRYILWLTKILEEGTPHIRAIYLYVGCYTLKREDWIKISDFFECPVYTTLWHPVCGHISISSGGPIMDYGAGRPVEEIVIYEGKVMVVGEWLRRITKVTNAGCQTLGASFLTQYAAFRRKDLLYVTGCG